MRGALSLVWALSIASVAGAAAAPRRAPARPEPAAPAAVRRPPAQQLPVQGMVRRQDGQPAAGVRIYLATLNVGTGMQFRRVTTDAAGHFQGSVKLPTDGSPRFAGVTAVVPGEAIAWQPLPLEAKGAAKPVELRLSSGSALSGVVLHPDGRLSTLATVRVSSFAPGFHFGRNTRPEEVVWRSVLRYVPDADLGEVFRGRTDAHGHFRIVGLPSDGQVVLRVAEELQLSPGSQAPVALRPGEQNAGILVAGRAGRIALKVIDRKTGRPATQLPVSITPTGNAFGTITDLVRGSQTDAANLTDVKGEINSEPLIPGDYDVSVGGFRQKVRILEGKTTGPVEMKIRTGTLQGRVLDSNGKAAVGAMVSLEVAKEALTPAEAVLAATGQGRSNAPVGRDGSFYLPQFPWGASEVTIRARRDNAQVEWKGPGEKLGDTLTLRLHPGALLSVTGRLVTPEHKPVAGAACLAIHWHDVPRINWFTNPNPVRTDQQGRFRISGLEREQAFSLISGGPFGGGNDEDQFETPRFTTSREAAVQDLGDVVVQPIDGAAQLLQVYGIESRKQLARLVGFLPVPEASGVQAARRALERYAEALRKGDLNAVQRLTSHSSIGWSANMEQFLLGTTLRSQLPAPGSAEEVRPLRTIPELIVAYLVGIPKGLEQGIFAPSFAEGARELEHPDWVFFGAGSVDSVRLAGMVHREAGEWRVVQFPFFTGVDELEFLSGPGSAPDPKGFLTPAPRPEQPEAAVAAASRYLRLWASGDDAGRLALTSPHAPGYSKDPLRFRKRQLLRPDGGVCPINGTTPAEPKMVTDFSVWELSHVAAHVISGAFGMGARGNPETVPLPDFPAANVAKGEVAAVSYRVGNQDCLMVLLRSDGAWKVLEPCIPH